MNPQIIIHILLLISSILGLAFALFVWLSDSKSWVNRFLALILLFADIWTISIYAGIITGNLLIANFAFLSTAIVLVLGNLLMLFFCRNLTKARVYLYSIPGFLIALTTIIDGLYVSKIDVVNGYIKIAQTGPLFYLFYIFALVYIILFIFNAWRALKINQGIERFQILYIIGGFLFGAVFGFIFNLILPLFNIFQFNSIGPIFIIFMAAASAFAATKHYLYDYQVVLSELWAFLLILISSVWLIINISIFNLILFLFLVSICILFIRSTISEAKKKKQLEKDKLVLQKLDSLKDEFLQMTEHELNTPIAIIEAKLSMILDEDMGSFTPKQKEYLRPVFKDAKRLAKLSMELAEVSEIDLGEIELFPEKINILDLVSEIIAKYRPDAEKKGLKIEIHAPENLPLVNLDQDKIKRVLSNLIDNAIKFTTNGVVKIEVTTQNRFLTVSVIDTGVGIKKEDLESIFGKFYQADRFSEIPMEQQGTGLSLYISKNLIKLHGGELWVESTPGIGSKFSFSLPIM